ncbi:hypothetical protein [Planotetraspora kaengkrachanensis]|uniref:Uncharacterized protein n=1 Tax=Planotetraspora kaengkrachanensis TaxID=575193 RepID=A0A8J3LVF6_9ACTN|nr:hypothetical protein [Planotetraspora kaengkrachanensis]GIG78509.1 hypothetical protein Pka01_16360 [Planotetraspora kaengkrachanensis]
MSRQRTANPLARRALTRRRLALLPAVIVLGTVVIASPAVATSTGDGPGGNGSNNSGAGSQKDKNIRGAQGNENQNKTHHNKRSMAYVRLRRSPVFQRGTQQLNSNSGVTAVQAASCKWKNNCHIHQNYWVGHW